MLVRWKELLWGDSALEETNTEDIYSKQELHEGLPLSIAIWWLQ